MNRILEIANHPVQVVSFQRLRGDSTPRPGSLGPAARGSEQVVPTQVRARPGGRLRANRPERPLEAGAQRWRPKPRPPQLSTARRGRATRNHTPSSSFLWEAGASPAKASWWDLPRTLGRPRARPRAAAPGAPLTCRPSSAGSFCSRHKGTPSSGSIPASSGAGSHDHSWRLL